MPNDIHGSDLSLAHLLLRFGLGVNFLMHGLSRLPDVPGFAAHLGQTMAKTWLPLPLVMAAGYTIPFVELALGLLLILGLLLRPALVLGALFMSALAFGTCLAQNWTVAAEQLIYLFLFAALLATAGANRYSIDAWRSA